MKRRIVLWLYLATTLLPLVWLVLSSFKSTEEIFASPWSLPKSLRWGNYAQGWVDAKLGSGILNSTIVSVGALLLILPLSAMAAYALARFRFRGSRLLLQVFCAQMMIPNFLVVIPLFLMLSKVGLVDTKLGLILVYAAYSLSFTIFVLHGAFEALPTELEEASKLDGCSEGKTFTRVMLPLARPYLVIVGIFNLIGLWNEYQLALVLLQKESNLTLPLNIAEMATNQQYTSNWGAMMAGMVLVMLPVLAVYWMFKDRIHQAMLAGSVK
ncbi:MAG: carbohydrate ABC transporter permease [Armatimonadetes bacterium]|nr:carbohydrate ABC transporter permease [Armatimonadota bacterium]